MRRENWFDKPHTLIIGPAEDGLEPPVTWRVVHPATCPWEAFRASSAWFGDESPSEDGRWYFSRACLTQYEIFNCGLDGVDGWEKLSPGRYEVVYESVYYPGEYGGSYGEEWDVAVSLRPLAAKP